MDLNLLLSDSKNPKLFFKKDIRSQAYYTFAILFTSFLLFIILKSELFLLMGVCIVICQFTIKRWIIQILLGGILIGYGILYFIIGINNNLSISFFGVIMFILAGLHFWEIKNYLKNLSLLETIEEDLNSDPNNSDLVFNKITLLNKLGRTEDVINSTETLIGTLENQQKDNNGGKYFDEKKVGDHEFQIYHNSNHKARIRIKKKPQWERIKNTIWYDFDVFESRTSINDYSKKKRAKQFGIWVLIAGFLLVISIYYLWIVGARLVIIMGILLIYCLYGFIKYSY